MDPPIKIPDPANGSRHQQQQRKKKNKKKGSGGSHRQRAKKYRECLRNHAASLGTHALDGCSEFIASASSDHADPSSLTCAACACHRNFHRLDSSPSPSPSPPSSSSDDEAGSHVLLTLKTAAAPPPETPAGEGGGRRKRFRSSFSREQKEGMMELAERIGWRLQRRDDEAIEESCRRIGVERGVFKVWMHNNKQAVTAMNRKKTKKKKEEASNDDDDDDDDDGSE